MTRITRTVRVEQSYYEAIEREASQGKRPIGSQIEILWDYWKGMEAARERQQSPRVSHNAITYQDNQEQESTSNS